MEKIHLHDFLKTTPQPAKTTERSLWSRHIRKLLQLANQLLVFPCTRFGKPSYQLRSRNIIDRLHMYDRGIAPVFTNGRGQPLKTLLVHRFVRQQVSGVAQRHTPVALKFSPDFHPLTGALARQRECQQQPSDARMLLRVHYSEMLDL